LISVLKRDDAPTKRHAIAFYPAITNNLQRIFRNHSIDLVYSNKGKLKDSLGNPKDKTKLLQKSGIYQVKCEGCDSVYIGQTKRSLTTRFGEHHYSIRLNYPDILHDMTSARKTTTEDTAYRWIILKLVKEVRKQNELDVYESHYISRQKKEDANLMNVLAGKITSRFFDLVP
jgi:hypothetical protein